MRTLTACAMLALLAPMPALAASLSATAPSGVKTRIVVHTALDSACKPQHVVLTITTPPANGSVTVGEENIALPAVTPLGGAQRCAGTVTPNAVLYYQSKPNFAGQDQIKYQRVNQDNPNDRLNGEMIMTVTVQ
jgi:hypothetical protein